MKPTRRWFQYSLRSFPILLTTSAVWLAVVVNRAREQREAVKAIEALGGQVRYDWEQDPFGPEEQTPYHPAWLPQLIGYDFFREVEEATFLSEFDLQQSLPHLKRLRKLQLLYIPESIAEETQHELKVALPDVQVVILRFLYLWTPALAKARPLN